MIAAVAFDLDDTLFLERDYVRSGFAAADRYLREHVDSGRDWFAALWADFLSGQHGQAFNRVLAAAGIEPDAVLVAELVRCYHEHRPQLALCDDVRPALDELGCPFQHLGVITDGPVVMQRNKFEALALADHLKHIIYTDRWGPEFRKPHPRAFIEFERLTGCAPADCAYVADNPAKDFRSPHQRGWTTVRVVRPGGLHADEPAAPGEVDHNLTSLTGLRLVLDRKET